MGPITVLGGNGFVGSRYCEMTPRVVKNNKYDYNIHTAEVVYFISTIDNYNVHTNPYIDIETNLTTLIKTLETHTNRKEKDITFNFISSWFVYGNVPLPAMEDGPTDPRGFYSITKRAAEQMLISYCETKGFNYRILRLANVLGETDTKVSAKKNALQYMINKLKNNEEIELYEGGEVYRDYIYVDDCVRAINQVIEKGEVNAIYNIGNGIPVYLDATIKSAKKKLKSKSNIKSIETKEFHKTVQAKDMVLNIDKIKELGYTPLYDMDAILDKLIK